MRLWMLENAQRLAPNMILVVKFRYYLFERIFHEGRLLMFAGYERKVTQGRVPGKHRYMI